MVGGNGCSGGETYGGCFSDEAECGSCGGKVNIVGNEVNRGCGGGTDGSGYETEADDDGWGGDTDGDNCGDKVEGGNIKDEADGGGCGGEIDCGGFADGEWQHSVNWKFSFSWLRFLIVFDIFEANLAFPFSIKCKWSL